MKEMGRYGPRRGSEKGRSRWPSSSSRRATNGIRQRTGTWSGHVLAGAVLLACLLTGACGNDNPVGPTGSDLTGSWTGQSTYPNAPFTLSLTQSGGTLRGEYRDRLDRSLSVTGTVSSSSVDMVVDFGDAKLNLQGTVLTARTVQGEMFTSALGNQRFAFTMTR